MGPCIHCPIAQADPARRPPAAQPASEGDLSARHRGGCARLAGEDGIPTPEQSLFLSETWRMRPETTRFTSEIFYESKLESPPDLAAQRLALPDGSMPQGLFLEAVPHEGNACESEEESLAVAGIFRRVLAGGATFSDREGETRPLALDDLLVVAPYNAQVERIRRALDAAGFRGAPVGTVDKFQGQEAPVAIYSLASSSAEDAARGMEFLYALDRLNVAMSRARVCTIVVASPRFAGPAYLGTRRVGHLRPPEVGHLQPPVTRFRYTHKSACPEGLYSLHPIPEAPPPVGPPRQLLCGM